MGLLIRTLLVWLLALAVPAQGATAATMALCGPIHQGQRSSVASVDHHLHGRHQPVQHQHGQADRSAGADGGRATSAVDGAAPSGPAQPSPHTDNHKCSACAVCCTVTALPSALPTLPAVEPSTARFAAVVIAVEAFAADGPERPPRPLLA